MSSPLVLPKRIASLSSEFRDSYDFANMNQVLSQIVEQTREKLESEGIPHKKKNLLRIESCLRRLLHDFGEQLTSIVINPLFSDEKVDSILQNTQNFPDEEIKDFLQEHITDKDIRELYTMQLPIDFDLLAGLNEEQLEFVKQRCLRELGKDSKRKMRRAFLLQAIKYLGYGYKEKPLHGKLSKSGVHTLEFAGDIDSDQAAIIAQIHGRKRIANLLIMHLIDGVQFLNSSNSFEGFEKSEQSLRPYQQISQHVNSEDISRTGRQYRANVISQKGRKIFPQPLSELDDDSLLSTYFSITKYTKGDHEKMRKLLIYITDYLGYKTGRGRVGLSCSSLVENIGVTKEDIEKIFYRKKGNPQELLLRTLVAVSDFNNGRDEFSQGVFEDVCKQVKEESKI